MSKPINSTALKDELNKLKKQNAKILNQNKVLKLENDQFRVLLGLGDRKNR